MTYALGADWNPGWLKLFTVFFQLIGIGTLVEILRRLGMAFIVVRAEEKTGRPD